MPCHIRIKDLALSYCWKNYEKKIFQDLNLGIEQGSFVTITGGNGSGKSSLIKLILGLISPGKGTVELAGSPVKAGFPTAVRHHQIAYLAQQIEELFFAETVREELAYNTENQAGIADLYLTELGLTHLLDRTIESLSGGERQSVALAQFMTHEAPLLLLDEPSSYQDQHRANLLKKYLKDAQMAGKTVLHVSQYQAEIHWGSHFIDLDEDQPRLILL
ncbi:MAG: energy-coupling factor ABC transporter ATP-binding protein [Candidatus Marinimicrobia bacterium]|nr:energy-coupling factor ABC transporter ATP-binding protein [Candidatus Neomarinimicrobiota bacterium]